MLATAWLKVFLRMSDFFRIRFAGAAALFLILAACAASAETLPEEGEILIKGIVSSVAEGAGLFVVNVSAVREAGAAADTLLQTKADKTVTLSATTKLLFGSGNKAASADVVPGIEVAAAGRNLGKGKELPAREVSLFAPESDAATAPGQPPAAVPPAPPAGVGPSTPPGIRPVNQVTAFQSWTDPAGVTFDYPAGWSASGAPGANPIVFSRGNVSLAVRRLPVNQGETTQSRAAAAADAAKAFAAGRKMRVTQSNSAVAAAPARLVTLRGEFQAADYSSLLGVPAASAANGPGVVYLAYVSVPENVGRQSWALEIACGGPESAAELTAQIMQRAMRSMRLRREEVREAPNFISPIRTAKTVEVENVLRQVGVAMKMYMTEEDVIPPNWEALTPYMGGSSKFMTNLKQGWPNWQIGPVQLLQPGQRVSELANPSAAVVGRADGPGFSIMLYADGHVARVNR